VNALITVFRELTGLFVDDGSLALAILAVIIIAALIAAAMPDVQLAAGAVLLFGCLGVLVANVLRAAQR
jgi:hypothetical protein